MMEMVWDVEMEAIAQRWTDQVIFIVYKSKYESHRNVHFSRLGNQQVDIRQRIKEDENLFGKCPVESQLQLRRDV